MRLVECLAEAGKVPFTVKVTKGGGQYRQGDELEITKVGVRSADDDLGTAHVGQVQYDFKNKTSGLKQWKWRHDSDAEFELVKKAEEKSNVPQEVLDFIGYEEGSDDGRFGCETYNVLRLVELIYKDRPQGGAGNRTA